MREAAPYIYVTPKEELLLSYRLATTLLPNHVSNRRGYKQGAIGTDNNPKQDGKRKATHRCSTKDEDDKHHKEGGD